MSSSPPPAPKPAPAEQRTGGERGTARFALVAACLGFGTFALATCELVLAGILPDIGRAFTLDVSVAGQVVTVFGVTAAVAGLVLATLTAAWRRRTVLLLSIGLYLLGTVGSALAPGFGALLGAQAVAAAGAGFYLPTATVTAATLAPEDQRGKAIAVVTTGLTFGTALGAPLGTAVAAVVGWRATMWGLAALAVLAGAAVLMTVPRQLVTASAGGFAARLSPLRNRLVLLLLLGALVAFTAIYTPYTYISAVFGTATGGDGVGLAGLVLGLGLMGVIGNLIAGQLVDRVGGRRIVTGALVLLAVLFAALPALASSYPTAVAAVVVYGLVGFSITTPQTHRLIGAAPENASLVVALGGAVLYLSIALSGALGGVTIAALGAPAFVLIPAAVLVVAAILSEIAHRTGGV
ncbi:MFS transporter [Pseudonocardia alni]|uniref:MFS transporter n=1 Tax=Pseudonocardia alni TaxID=33907 RepID=UPI0033C14648